MNSVILKHALILLGNYTVRRISCTRGAHFSGRLRMFVIGFRIPFWRIKPMNFRFVVPSFHVRIS